MARPKSFDPQVALDRAVESFWQQGYDGVPVQELCRAMGLNPGSLYGAYGDKRTLFLAVLERYTATVFREAVEHISREPSGLAGIQSYFDHLVEGMLDGKRRWGCLFTNTAVQLADRDPEIAEKVAAHFGRLEGVFASALARAHADGEVSQSGVEAAPFFVSIVQGLHVTTKLKPSRERLELIVGTALRGIGCADEMQGKSVQAAVVEAGIDD